METFDMQKLMTSITYLDRIADGKNPVNNTPVPDDSILNDPNIIRCMFFVKEVLEAVKRNSGVVGGKNKEPAKMDFPFDVLSAFEYKEDKPITKLVDQFNEMVDVNIYKKLTYKPIRDWLKAKEYLEEQYFEKYHKNILIPTEKGKKLGIVSEERISITRPDYIVLIYTKPAQEFIVNNIENILNGEVVLEDEVL